MKVKISKIALNNLISSYEWLESDNEEKDECEKKSERKWKLVGEVGSQRSKHANMSATKTRMSWEQATLPRAVYHRVVFFCFDLVFAKSHTL